MDSSQGSFKSLKEFVVRASVLDLLGGPWEPPDEFEKLQVQREAPGPQDVPRTGACQGQPEGGVQGKRCQV